MEKQKYTTAEEKTKQPSVEETKAKTALVEDGEDELHLMEQFMSDPAHDYRRLQYGATIDGTIMRIDKEGILVDIGGKAEGVVPTREMQTLTAEERALLQIGAELLVFVIQAEDKEGYAILSIDRARQEKSWRYLQQAYERGNIIQAQVVNYNKGGLLVDLDSVRGFVPSSQVERISRVQDSQKQSDMARLIGQKLALKVIEINRSRNRLILSERQAVQDERESRKDELLSSIKEGDILTGTISSICDFGVFVDIGSVDGLVHLSELSWGRVRHPGEILKVGQQVQTYILSIDYERKRVALSIKRTQNEPWAHVSERYTLGQIVEGTVTQLTQFGAFACLEEGIEGLIHISELGDGHVQHPSDVVKEGDLVKVRIIRIDPTRKRMGLSMLIAQDNAEHELHLDNEDSLVDGIDSPTV